VVGVVLEDEGIMDQSKSSGGELLPLRRMATRLGVPSRWLRDQAVRGKVPGLQAGNRWLFVPDVATAAVRAMACDGMAGRAVENEGGSK
jgi:hypothetical protein